MGSISPAEVKQSFKTPWIETPLVESASLSRAAGCRVFLKLENVQPSGSFKSRAMGNQILSHLIKPENANRPVHFYASSGGNAGLAAVCAARSLGYPCTVVVPLSTKPLMVQKLRTAGAADVIQHGSNFFEAGDYMREVIMKTTEDNEAKDVVKIALHPFDNEPIWEGNSTIVDELVTQLPPAAGDDEETAYKDHPLPVDAILCSVGGGGLLNGLIMGIERHRQLQKSDLYNAVTTTSSAVSKQSIAPSSSSPSQSRPISLLAIETIGTDSLAAAVAQKSLVSIPSITSQATSLGAIKVSERTFQYATAPPPGIAVHSAVLSDADAARGCLRLADEERLLVELACGVCVEAAIGDGIKARSQSRSSISSSSSSTTSALAQAQAQAHPTKKRKYTHTQRDEGYGDDRLSAEENDEPLSSSSPSESFQSHLKKAIPDLNADSRVVIIVCGGSNVTIDMAAEWRALLKEGWGDN